MIHHSTISFFLYFSPISAGMFVFGIIKAIKHTIKGNEDKVLIHGIVSTTGLFMLFGALIGAIAW